MLRDPACGTRRCPPWVTASRCVRSGHRFAPHLVPFPDRRQFVGSGMLGALAHAGLMCRNRLGMPRVVHSVTLAPRHVFAAVVTVPGGMFRRLAQIGRLGRRRRWRLGLNGRRGRIGSGCAGRLRGEGGAGDQAGRKQRRGEFGQIIVFSFFSAWDIAPIVRRHLHHTH